VVTVTTSIEGGLGEDSIPWWRRRTTRFHWRQAQRYRDGGDGDDSISGVRGDDVLFGGEYDTIERRTITRHHSLAMAANDPASLGGFGVRQSESVVKGDENTIIAGGGDDNSFAGRAVQAMTACMGNEWDWIPFP